MRTGRPKLIINQDLFEDLCQIQCTRTEITAILHVSEPTLRRWVHRTYGGRTFDAVHSEKAEAGKQSLRRAQIKTALSGNATMQIWLGKQYLGQSDKLEIDHRIESEIERELARLAASSQTEVPRRAEADTDSRLVN